MTVDEKLVRYISLLGPTLGAKPEATADLVARLSAVGVGITSYGDFAITSREHAGRDVAEYILSEIKPRADARYLFADSPPPKTAPDVATMSATQKLDHANGSVSRKYF